MFHPAPKSVQTMPPGNKPRVTAIFHIDVNLRGRTCIRSL